MRTTTSGFDPCQFIVDAWRDIDDVKRTAAAGSLTEADQAMIRDHLAVAGLAGDDLDDAVSEACEAVLEECERRVAGYHSS